MATSIVSPLDKGRWNPKEKEVEFPNPTEPKNSTLDNFSRMTNDIIEETGLSPHPMITRKYVSLTSPTTKKRRWEKERELETNVFPYNTI